VGGVRRWSASAAYSESKLHILLLAFAVPRLWPGVIANAVDPGWVPTRMGGPSAPDDLVEGCLTQVELAAPDLPDSVSWTALPGCAWLGGIGFTMSVHRRAGL
jgi:NAD(P)-dependent dehydrogenase (short-subunit alcohol dehydrogenase family)